ncbi:ABC transporter permease [Actinomycetospora sp. Odt1-22]|uniref:ABC transporter permease n=1 Tax=Actinomycetospora termitidis TaxID=3053470 RepID=A0ABT7M2H5_9PSEU|nr:ABC transporter permease [Actinomycetospora sp. Odt1-22]MDL5154631.1 ABC transporter permease [Actinomycetospora sp. Odt1-22]
MHGASPRSWRRAFHDIRQAIAQRELWGHLGWQDIKQRYRRSTIGPLWITISMAVTAAALGGLYSQLFGQPIGTFMPYVTVGFMIWYFISACVLEGTETFIANEGLIRFLPAPLMIYVFRTVWRQVLFFAHNVVVYVIVLAIFFGQLDEPYRMINRMADGTQGVLHPGLSWTALLAIPAFVVIVANGLWVTLLFGIIATRFRDIPPVVSSFMQLFFTMTPIIWTPDLLRGGEPGSARAIVEQLAKLNPFYHFIEIFRAPLVGQVQSWTHWAVVGVITVVGWALALIALRNYRSRVAYWV